MIKRFAFLAFLLPTAAFAQAPFTPPAPPDVIGDLSTAWTNRNAAAQALNALDAALLESLKKTADSYRALQAENGQLKAKVNTPPEGAPPTP